jgi:hypothetical protein
MTKQNEHLKAVEAISLRDRFKQMGRPSEALNVLIGSV